MLQGLHLWCLIHGQSLANWPGRPVLSSQAAPVDRETIPILTVGLVHALDCFPPAAVGQARPARADRDGPRDSTR